MRAEKNAEENQPIGTIPIDAIFSPVRKVSYTVTQARVGQITDYDKLTLEIWSDGSVKPEDALAFAAKILKDQLAIFINFEEQTEALEEEVRTEPAFNENLFRSVDELEVLCTIRKLPEKCRYSLYRRACSKDRAGDAQNQEFRP